VATRIGILGRVGEQVRDHLRQPHGIAVERGRRPRQVDVEPVPALVDQRPRHLHGHLDDRVELHRLRADLELATRDARHVEQVVEQRAHVAHLALDHATCPVDLGRAGLRRPEQGGGVADRRERVAQLVRERGDEAVLLAVGLAQRFLGFAPRRHVHRQALQPHQRAAVVELADAALVQPDDLAVRPARAVRRLVHRASRRKPLDQLLQPRPVVRQQALEETRARLGGERREDTLRVGAHGLVEPRIVVEREAATRRERLAHAALARLRALARAPLLFHHDGKREHPERAHEQEGLCHLHAAAEHAAAVADAPDDDQREQQQREVAPHRLAARREQQDQRIDEREQHEQ
jgi:hypothetical protein